MTPQEKSENPIIPITKSMVRKQTAMQVLKSKIQDAIGEMNGELNPYSSGYKQCLINIQNDIDAQMMELEKEHIVDAHYEGQCDNTEGYPKYISQQYYNETYGHNQE